MTGPNSKTEDTETQPETIMALFPEECVQCGGFGLTFTTDTRTFENCVCGQCLIAFITKTKADLKDIVEK